MANITHYTFSKLCRKLEVNRAVNLELFLSTVFNDPKIFFILNKMEINYLFIYKSILEDEKKFKLNYYQQVPERLDSENYVFEQGGKLKFHLSAECAFLKKDFIDFNIPEEIKGLGSQAVYFFRDWFKEKGYAESYYNGTLDPSLVVFSYNTLFPRKYNVPVLNENYKLITQKPNSNFLSIEKIFTKDEFQNALETLKFDYQRLFPCKNTRVISKFSYLLNKPDSEIKNKMSEIFSEEFVKNYSLEKFKEKFRLARDLKKQIIGWLLDYFKWFYKLDRKNFDISTLEHFGLELCGSCKKNDIQQYSGEV